LKPQQQRCDSASDRVPEIQKHTLDGTGDSLFAFGNRLHQKA
jgi:hypothetical protein